MVTMHFPLGPSLGYCIFCTIVLLTLTIFWVESSPHSIKTTSKAHCVDTVEKVKRSEGGKH